ncbi:MAG: bifunctional ornithine acetyltransferase/N-acetylglutamate synthase [Methanobacteriaceae archaeon]|jgi:glutamate N-acetyltransferase/amino-acid N-acetyltransferase
MEIINGGICAVEGVLASGSRKEKYGVAVIFSEESTASAVFTSNRVVAAPVILTKEAVKDSKISAIVANSGNANCFTGREGLEDAKLMAEKVATKLNIKTEDVAVASTGIIGRKMPMNIIGPLIDESIKTLENSPEASFKAAEAIMTTDTYPKEISVQSTLTDGKLVKIGGIIKGSGMIAPNMGTMVCFITTDLNASGEDLNEALKRAVSKSFNMVVVDGDESTNDMVILLSTGKSGKIDEKFQGALDFVCIELAKMMAKDGEGATKYMEVTVNGAASKEDAKRAAKAVASSSLVKTALFGADPNWGRVIAATGYSGAEIDEKKVDIVFESENKTVEIVKKGSIIATEKSRELEIAEKIMKGDEIKIIVNLNLGEYSATAYGCDLSYDYVKINSRYST